MMKTDDATRLETWLARLLGLGTWACCAVLALGMMLLEFGASLRPAGSRVVTVGVILLIALPTLRVVLMAVWFVLDRERDLALVAGLVLAIIVVSTLLGVGGV